MFPCVNNSGIYVQVHGGDQRRQTTVARCCKITADFWSCSCLTYISKDSKKSFALC